MPRLKPLTLERLGQFGHIRIRRGIQWSVTIRPDEAIDLANAIVDMVEKEEVPDV